MSSGAIVILCLAGVALSIILNYKLSLNMGLSALAFAFIIGCLFMGMKVKEVIALFPTSIFFQVMCLSLFFGYGVVNGTMGAIADHMLYACRKRPWMFTFMLMFTGFLLGFVGCTPPAAGAIMAVMAFTIAIPAGMNPLIACAVAFSNNAGSFVLWGASGGIINATIASNGFESDSVSQTWIIYAMSVLMTVIVILVFFFLLKGYKMSAIPDMKQPEPFTKTQIANLYVIAVVIFLAVVPGVLKSLIGGAFLTALANFCDMQVLCIIGFLVCALLHLASQKDVIKAVPWNTLLLLSGISTLMSVAVEAGAVDMITSWLAANIPAVLLPMFMCLLGGFLSAFSGGITTVFPMVAPIVPALVQSSGASPVLLFLGTVLGAHFTSMSPFSTGGAVFLATCRDDDMAKRLVPGQLLVCAVALVLAMVFITALEIFF